MIEGLCVQGGVLAFRLLLLTGLPIRAGRVNFSEKQGSTIQRVLRADLNGTERTGRSFRDRSTEPKGSWIYREVPENP